MRAHPFAIIIAAVRERTRVRHLSPAQTRKCLDAARAHYSEGASVAASVAIGQRLADSLSCRKGLHPFRRMRGQRHETTTES
jgi:hypothetical protein